MYTQRNVILNRRVGKGKFTHAKAPNSTRRCPGYLLVVLVIVGLVLIHNQRSNILTILTSNKSDNKDVEVVMLSKKFGDSKESDAALFENAKQKVKELSNLIYQRFVFRNSYFFQFFMISWNIPTRGWDILKYKIAQKIVDGSSSFLMIFGGSSVTAGYDNHFNESYPLIVQKRMGPIFDALKIDLQVRNIAQRRVSCHLSNLCYEAMGGTGGDFIGWENSYSCANQKGALEFPARWAGWNKAVVYYSASGGFTTEDCKPSEESVSRLSEEWAPSSGQTGYTLDAQTISSYRHTQNQWFMDGNSVERFTSVLSTQIKTPLPSPAPTPSSKESTTTERNHNPYLKKLRSHQNKQKYPFIKPRSNSQGWNPVNHKNNQNIEAVGAKHRQLRSTDNVNISRIRMEGNEGGRHVYRGSYQGVAAHGFSVWGKSRQLCNLTTQYLVQFADTVSSDGINIGTVGAQPVPSAGCKAMDVRGQCRHEGGPAWLVGEGGGSSTGKQYHPTAGMHLFRAEVLAYNYAQIVADAIFTVQRDLLSMTAAEASTVYARRLAQLQVDIPEEPFHCASVECREKPRCYTDSQPNYNPAQLLSAIVVGEHIGWKLVDMEENSEEHLTYRYLDRKLFYEGYGANKQIHFQLYDVRRAVRVYGRVSVGQALELKNCLFFLDPGVSVTSGLGSASSEEAQGQGERSNDHTVPRPSAAGNGATPSPPYSLSSKAYAIQGNYSAIEDSVHFEGIPAGSHVLTIITDPHRPDQITPISHVVVF